MTPLWLWQIVGSSLTCFTNPKVLEGKAVEILLIYNDNAVKTEQFIHTKLTNYYFMALVLFQSLQV